MANINNNKFDNMTPAQFTHELFGIIRVLYDADGEIWFVAKDVCDALGINNPSQAVSYLDEDEQTLITNEGLSNSRNPHIVIINESGLYSLILRSRKPEAKKFKKWVTGEVLPSIRKHGAYIDESTASPKFLREMADIIEQKNMVIAEKSAALAEATPKAALASTMTDDMRKFSIRVAKYELSNRIGRKVSESLIRKVLLADGLLEPVRGLLGEQQRYIPTPAAYEIGLCVRAEEGQVGPLYFFTLNGMEYLVERLSEIQEAA